MKEITNEIIDRAGLGEELAFEKIYKASAGFVYNTALRIVADPEDAKEVTQEVFIKIYREIKGFEFRSSFKTWVYRITANTALNKCRARGQRGREVAIDTRMAANSAQVRGSEESLIGKENKRELTELLQTLNPDQRACIVLRELEGLSYSEIADTLEVNINTVRTRLLRARIALLKEAKKR
ncbi:MAG: sigma-70 family RNA polymerase sigma factor [Thermodesulfobacteriota bacterium]